MKCSKISVNIEAYLGGTLPPKLRKKFEKHIESCLRCRSELQRCRDEDSLYRQALAPRQMQGSLKDTVLARVRFEYAAIAEERAIRKRTAIWLTPIAAAAQFILAFWLSSTVMSKSVTEVRETGQVKPDDSGRIMAVKWIKSGRKVRYYPVKRADVTPRQKVIDTDTQVD